MKNPLTPAGIEPATFRFVAQHLNHYATAVPQKMRGTYIKVTQNLVKQRRLFELDTGSCTKERTVESSSILGVVRRNALSKVARHWELYEGTHCRK